KSRTGSLRPTQVRGGVRPARGSGAGAHGHAFDRNAAGADRRGGRAEGRAAQPEGGAAQALMHGALASGWPQDERMTVAATRTRDRILEASLALFNQDGLAAGSTHRIAAELGISSGNLHYHFKAKQLIVGGLFRRFEERLSASL